MLEHFTWYVFRISFTDLDALLFYLLGLVLAYAVIIFTFPEKDEMFEKPENKRFLLTLGIFFIIFNFFIELTNLDALIGATIVTATIGYFQFIVKKPLRKRKFFWTMAVILLAEILIYLISYRRWLFAL